MQLLAVPSLGRVLLEIIYQVRAQNKFPVIIGEGRFSDILSFVAGAHNFKLSQTEENLI